MLGNNRFQIGQYEVNIGNKISEGGYAFVYKATNTKTQEVYALKKIYIGNRENARAVKREVQTWRRLGNHPNIVRFLDCTVIEENDMPHMYVLCELCKGGHLLNLLEKYQGVLQERQIVFIMQEICAGLALMHE